MPVLRSGKIVGCVSRRRSPTAHLVVPNDAARPTFDWWGDLLMYLKPQPVWKRLPSLKNLRYVYLLDRNTVHGQLHGYVFLLTVTTGSQFTYMTYELAEKVGLHCKIIKFDYQFVQTFRGRRALRMGYTKQVTIVLTGNIQLKTNVYVLPRDATVPMQSHCHVGSQTMADNRILQQFFEERSVLYGKAPYSNRRKSVDKGCYLSGHLHSSLMDPTISIMINSGDGRNYVCRKGMEAFPTFACCFTLKRLNIPMDSENKIRLPMHYAQEVDDTYFLMGSDILGATSALLDYSGGYMYMKVHRKWYRIEMKTFEDVCRQCGRCVDMDSTYNIQDGKYEQTRTSTKRKRDHDELDDEGQVWKKRKVDDGQSKDEQNKNDTKRKRDHDELDDEGQARKKRTVDDGQSKDEQNKNDKKRTRDDDECNDGRQTRSKKSKRTVSECRDCGKKRKVRATGGKDGKGKPNETQAKEREMRTERMKRRRNKRRNTV